MLGGLIDYLWSPNANSQVTSCTKEETSPGVNSRSADEFEFVLVEVSDATGEDWVYIEEPEQQQASSAASDASDGDDRESHSSESSWIVTPPGCFAGPVWEEPERNELEDLLIEHPSMSVYNTPTSQPHAVDDEMNLATVQPNRTDVARSWLLQRENCRLTYELSRPTRSAKSKDKPKALKRHNMTQERLSKKTLRQRRCIQRGIVCPRKH